MHLKNRLKIVLILTWVSVLLLIAGCMNNRDNQMEQQGTQARQDGLQMQQQGQDQRQGNINQRIQVANQAADKVVKIKGVTSANVLVTQRNAYVGAVLINNQEKLSRNIEDQIAKQVRSTDRSIRNVYVSTNPDFVDRINNYANDVQQGRPVAGFFDEFNEMVQRLFPNAK